MTSRVGVERISKRQFYTLGGFKNPALFRKHDGRSWRYYRDHGHG